MRQTHPAGPDRRIDVRKETLMTMQSGTTRQTATLACKLLGAEFARRKAQISDDLFSHVEETAELDDAFEFRFSAESPIPEKVIEFIREERQCCPFFAFDLQFLPDGGPLWLRIGGSPEAKQFVLDELGIVA
jgi:hypothetical protein